MKFRYGMSLQFKSGGGGGMQTVGYAASQLGTVVFVAVGVMVGVSVGVSVGGTGVSVAVGGICVSVAVGAIVGASLCSTNGKNVRFGAANATTACDSMTTITTINDALFMFHSCGELFPEYYLISRFLETSITTARGQIPQLSQNSL